MDLKETIRENDAISTLTSKVFWFPINIFSERHSTLLPAHPETLIVTTNPNSITTLQKTFVSPPTLPYRAAYKENFSLQFGSFWKRIFSILVNRSEEVFVTNCDGIFQINKVSFDARRFFSFAFSEEDWLCLVAAINFRYFCDCVWETVITLEYLVSIFRVL